TSEDILIQAAKAAVASGIRADKNFKPQVYQTISADLVRAGYSLDAQQVKSRWNRFKAHWKIVNYLCNLSGFGWDEDKKCVTATGEVCRNLLYNADGSKKKNFDNYNYFKTHNFPYYDDLSELIGDSTAQGDQAFSSTSTSVITIDSQEDNDEDSEGSATTNSQLPAYNVPPSAGTKRTSTPPATPIKKRARPTSSAQIGQLFNTVDKLITGLVSPVKALTPTTRKIHKDNTWKTIKNEEGLSPYSLSKAMRVLGQGDDVVEDYLRFDSVDEEEREARAFWLAEEI
ncbi:hypothetical protein K435DRAFT_561100, partial [Dendrothele bispora CBS 962.96]